MYTLAAPHPDLRPYIEHYWSVSAGAGAPIELSVKAFVDARADLVFNFGDPYRRAVIGRRPRIFAASNLDAQRDVPIEIVQRGAVSVAGVRFRTGGIAPFVREPLARYTNRTPGLAEVFGEDGPRLDTALSDRRSRIDDQKELLDAFLLGRLRIDPGFTPFRDAMDAIEEDGGSLSIEETSHRAGISPRNLGRLFDRLLGFSPKHFARIARFQKALRILVADPTMALGVVGAECGYFDQSHFVKDFRQFTGGISRGYRGSLRPIDPADFAPNVVRFLQDDGKP